MTYNIRACLGTDRVRSLDRVAGVIAAEEPAVVALQEVDLRRTRSELVDQAAELGDRLGMYSVAGVSFRDADGGSYGNAVLTRDRAELVRHGPLPALPGNEPRTAMWVRVLLGGGSVDVMNTHVSFRRRERPMQLEALLGGSWLVSAGPNVVLCGDLNCSPREKGLRGLLSVLDDAQGVTPGPARATWPARQPFRRLDYILVSRGIEVEAARVCRGGEARRASDHCPVVADLRVRET